jgi:2-methylaconitate cis-trans-isomerase PrpF
MQVFALAMHAITSDAVRVVAKSQKRCHVAVGDQPNVSALTAIATVWTAHGFGAFTTERHTSGSAVTGAHIQLAFVDEMTHQDLSLLPDHDTPVDCLTPGVLLCRER